MKLHEWLNDLSPWSCCLAAEMAVDFKLKTDHKAPWTGYPARVANATVGTFKGLQQKLDVPDDTLMVDGWKAALAVWHEYGESAATAAEKECISMLNGRGSIANACVASLKRQDL